MASVPAEEYNAFRVMDPMTLLQAVIVAGIKRGLWTSSGQFARNELVRDPRTIRRWRAGSEKDRIEIPTIVLDRLAALAVELDVDRENPDTTVPDESDEE